jgi:hypothetical protein
LEARYALRAIPLGIVFVSTLLSCANDDPSKVTSDAKLVTKEFALPSNHNLDLLFVVDNSGSMADEQAELRQVFPRFASLISSFKGLPNLHLGVITTDLGTRGGPPLGEPGRGRCAGVGDDGVLREVSGHPGVRFLSDLKNDTTGARAVNYEGQLPDAFSALANVGTTGCGMESPLAAMQRALENPVNAGFLRDDAALAVVFITDEDDCSLRPDQGPAFFGQTDLAETQSFACFRSSTVCDGNLGDKPGPRKNCRPAVDAQYHANVQSFVDYLKSKKADPSRVFVAGIFGDPTPVAVESIPRYNGLKPEVAPSCTSTSPDGPQLAYPGVRLDAFLRAFPNSSASSICQGGVTASMLQIGAQIRDLLGAPCFAPKVAEPYQCSVYDVTDAHTAREAKVAILPCASNGNVTPCWTMAKDPVTCAETPSELALHIERGTGAAPAGSRVVASCRIE